MHSFSFGLILKQTNQHFDKTTWKNTSDRVSIGCPPSFYRDPIMKQQSVTKRTLDRWEIRAATGKSGVPLPGWGIRCIKVIEFSWNLATVTSFFLYVWAHSRLCDSISGTTPTNPRAAIVRVDDDGDFAGWESPEKWRKYQRFITIVVSLTLQSENIRPSSWKRQFEQLVPLYTIVLGHDAAFQRKLVWVSRVE